MTLLDGVKKIFEFNFEPCPEIELAQGPHYSTVLVEEQWVPIFTLRTNPKIEGMKTLDILGKACALTAMSVNSENLDRILFQELDIAEYLLDTETNHITSYTSGNSVNLIAGFDNGATAHMQLHSSRFGSRQFHHELITDQGMVSDRAADTVIAQQALNLYTEAGYEFYTDSDFLLYGLSDEDQELAYGIYECFHSDIDILIKRGERLSMIIEATLSKNRTCHAGEDF